MVSVLPRKYLLCLDRLKRYGRCMYPARMHHAHVLSSRNFDAGGLTAVTFVVGALTSILSGFIGMMVAGAFAFYRKFCSEFWKKFFLQFWKSPLLCTSLSV